jgi:mono/diheme cytochrome c family protein
MRTVHYGGLVAALLLGVAPLAEAADAAVSYKTDIQPIFNAQCVFCHVTGAENAGLNLGRRESRASLMAPSSEAPLPRVTPGDPEKSYLVHKLRGTHLSVGGSGNAMPMYDPPRPFDAALLERISRWIQNGAPDN